MCVFEMVKGPIEILLQLSFRRDTNRMQNHGFAEKMTNLEVYNFNPRQGTYRTLVSVTDDGSFLHIDSRPKVVPFRTKGLMKELNAMFQSFIQFHSISPLGHTRLLSRFS